MAGAICAAIDGIMRMAMLFIYLLLMLGVGRAAAQQLDNESDELTNELIDQALERIRNRTDIDPYQLHEDYRLELYQTLGLIPVDICPAQCNIGIRTGKMFGLSRMQRISNGTFGNEDQDLLVDLTLGIRNLVLQANVSLTLGSVELFEVPVLHQVRSIRLRLLVAVRGKRPMRLRQLRVQKIHGVKLRLLGNGGGPVDALLGWLSELVVSYFNQTVRAVLSRALFRILSTELRYMSQ